MLSLNIHDKNQGKKMFNYDTTYDYYCLHNIPYKIKTIIKCQDGSTARVDLSKMEYIPNGMFKEYEKLIQKNGEETVKTSRDHIYGTQKNHMSKIQTDEFKYPVVYLTYYDGKINFYYSNINTLGHFGVPKVIWSRGVSMPIIDSNGEYGMTEFTHVQLLMMLINSHIYKKRY